MGNVREVVFRELMRELVPSPRYLTHGIYYYPARFIPHVVRYVIETYGENASWVADPFVGSGTTCVEALVTGRNCYGLDINPFSEFLVKLKTMKLPVGIEEARRSISTALGEAAEYRGEPFHPSWGSATYWYREDVYEELCRLWGYVHSVKEKEYIWRILSAALLKVSRKYSYTDDQIPKLYRSKMKKERLEKLLAGEWRSVMLEMFRREATRILESIAELNRLLHGRKWPIIEVETETDASTHDPSRRASIVVTSPPYLIAHEYFRSTKLELFWLGYGEKEIRVLAKREIPYNKPPDKEVFSETYRRYRGLVASRKKHLVRYYESYFKSVLAALERQSPVSGGILAVFIGPATLAGTPIPVHEIIREHMESLGYTHIETLVDKIARRKIFRGRRNENPNGITREYLLVMRAP